MNAPRRIIAGYAMDHSLGGVTEEDASLLTYLFLAFAVVEDGDVTDRLITQMPEVQRIRACNPNLRIIVSVGGWGAGGFSEAAATPAGRARFARTAVAIVERRGLDGIDIDWEYPCYSEADIASSPRDKENYTLLMEAVRAELDRLARRTGRRYELTTAVGADQYYIDGSEMDRIASLCDLINVMTYDMRGGFQILTGHHTGLFTPTGDLFRISADASVRMYVQAGVPPGKILLGAAFYSRRWLDVPDRNHGLFQMSPGSGKHGPRYTEIVRDLLPGGAYARYWDDEAKAPWLFDGSTFVSYDDEESIAHKCRYVLENGYGGLFYWEHGCDETRTLLRAVHDEFLQDVT